jgi:hypothetical protein
MIATLLWFFFLKSKRKKTLRFFDSFSQKNKFISDLYSQIWLNSEWKRENIKILDVGRKQKQYLLLAARLNLFIYLFIDFFQFLEVVNWRGSLLNSNK